MLVLALLNGALFETPGWNETSIVPITDAIGTTLFYRVFDLVTDDWQAGPYARHLIQTLSMVASGVAIPLSIVGSVWGKAADMRLFRLLLGAGIALMGYLLLTNYLYGYSKAQAMITFLVVTSVALGVERLWDWSTIGRTQRRNSWRSSRRIASDAAVVVIGVMLCAVVTSFGLAAFAFWKPVGNSWKTSSWDASELGTQLQAGEEVQLSPNILADPESVFATIYSLRRQSLQGRLVVDKPLGKAGLLSDVAGRTNPPPPAIEVLGTNELEAVAGFEPSDEIWTGSLVKAYRSPSDRIPIAAQSNGTTTDAEEWGGRLPATLHVGSQDSVSDNLTRNGKDGHLILVLAADAPTDIQAKTGTTNTVIHIENGVAVRSLPIAFGDRVDLANRGETDVWLLSAIAKGESATTAINRDYPQVVAVVGNSEREGSTVTFSFVYLDIGVPAFHSVDLYSVDRDAHAGWFELPTYPDGKVKSVRFELDPQTMMSKSSLNGSEVTRRSSAASSLSDGKYIAYFSIWSGANLAKRIPIYTFTMVGGNLIEFHPIPIIAAWDGSVF